MTLSGNIPYRSILKFEWTWVFWAITLKIKIWLGIGFDQITNNNAIFHSWIFSGTPNSNICQKNKVNPLFHPFLAPFAQIWPYDYFPKKSSSMNFWQLLTSSIMQKVRKKLFLRKTCEHTNGQTNKGGWHHINSHWKRKPNKLDKVDWMFWVQRKNILVSGTSLSSN